ncbi:MAG: hypothetical protein HKN25_15055 [Pyrinomonadaceae bacterium]|nr:hypothetical protein [Pyrinomonadaceae bacterium]
MTEEKHDRRSSVRNTVPLPLVVKGRESSDEFWKEETEIINVSRLGANFNLQRECPAGRIVSLMLKMPKHLRCYDLDKKLYRVWGLVQHCAPVSTEDAASFQIGVAFVGKNAPKSYVENPMKSYRVSGMDSDGFWNLGEAKTPFITRAHHRFAASIDARIAALGPDGEEELIDDEAKTENVGAGGAAVFSSLELNSGDRVKFSCAKPAFTSICVVRNRQISQGEGAILHLEFAEPNFPTRDIGSSSENDEEILEVVEPDNAGEPTTGEDSQDLDLGDSEE